MEKPIRVRILDHEYLLKSDEGEKQVQEVAQFVDEKFREIRDNTKGLSEAKTAILAAFHVASEYFQALREYDDLVKEVQDRSQALNNRIDSVTKPIPSV